MPLRREHDTPRQCLSFDEVKLWNMELAGILKASPVPDISSENSLGHQRAYRQLSRRPGPTAPDAAQPAPERRASPAGIAAASIGPERSSWRGVGNLLSERIVGASRCPAIFFI
jgi:hypothetical protein